MPGILTDILPHLPSITQNVASGKFYNGFQADRCPLSANMLHRIVWPLRGISNLVILTGVSKGIYNIFSR